jgi:hypothetical protein
MSIISSFKNLSAEKGLMYALIVALLIVFIFVSYLFLFHGVKSVKLLTPRGGEEIGIGTTYQITWKARGIKKVGIVLFKEKQAKWIARNIDARAGKYDWKIYPDQRYGGGYWVAVFEYPWRPGNKISYSARSFAIIYSKTISCDSLSLENEWPYLPSNFPNLRKVFITEKTYTGNLGGLDGADKKCQQEAEKQGFKGEWQAFLGGDGDKETAVERMKTISRKTEGVFVEAKPSAELTKGETCHRLLGKNFKEFLAKLSDYSLVNKEKLRQEFLENLSSVWLGRIDEKSKKNCVPISSLMSNTYKPLAEKYSFTDTCQNWTQDKEFVAGYPVPKDKLRPEFPVCYTSEGRLTEAVALGGLAEGLNSGRDYSERFTPYQGKLCLSKQRLICIEK